MDGEMISLPAKELEALQERARRLAREKSFLQLANDQMKRLSVAPGLENTVEMILGIVVNSLGGSNVAVYYLMDSQIHYADVYGGRKVVREVEDPMVRRVFESSEFIEDEVEFSETKMITPEFTKSSSWALPLTVGERVIGVLKAESMLVAGSEVRDQLKPLFGYMALVLNNEIENYSKLFKAHDQLAKANEELRKSDKALHKAYEELEARVVERTAQLRETNEQLQTELAERRRAEKALAKSEEQYRRIVETANEGILELDGDNTITYVNQSMADMLGYVSEELTGRSFVFLLFAEDLEDHREKLLHLKTAKGLLEKYYRRLRRRDGGPCWTIVSVTSVKSADGLFVGAIGMFTDVTRRKLAEEERLRVHRQNELILNAAQEGIIGLDLNGRVIFVNRSAADTLGFSIEDLTGAVFHDIAHHSRPDGAPYPFDTCPARQTFAAGASWRMLHEVLWKKDGSGFPALYSSAPILEEGIVQGAVVTFRDISYQVGMEKERRELEERLQRAEKMEALGALAGGVAHDLNNVLGVVVGYSELLIEDLGESTSQAHARAIMKSGQRAAAIVQDMLTLARRGVHTKKILDLNKIILDCLDSREFAQALTCHPNIGIRTDFDPSLLSMSGSPVHLEKSFLNLVSNAAEAMPDGGLITMKTANCYLDKPLSGYDEVRQGDYIVLTVSDTGQGIPATDLNRIFEPFYTRKVMGRSGTGLGLAVVWGTIKDHDGYIDVESREGEGTAFTLYFPVTRGELTPEVVAVSAAKFMGNGESILVVDDVAEQRELAARMLSRLNYQVATVASGEDALEFLRHRMVDVIVLDMIMEPGMDGLETYLEILKLRPCQKAIIVSGFSETDRVNRAQELGAGAYVKKPYVLEKLGLAVRKEIDPKA